MRNTLALRLRLYERFVQTPGVEASMLATVHGAGPRTLREDFSGGGGVCKSWAAAGGRATAVDRDRRVLAGLRGLPGLRAVAADVMRCDARADVIAALNFPLGYWHTRPQLVAYLKASRRRLTRGGVFVADTYGGADAMKPGTHRRRGKDAELGVTVTYVWEQRHADPTTNRVLNAIHFTLTRGSRRVAMIRDAFIYDWRLWSIAELTDACTEAGFSRIEIYDPNDRARDHLGHWHPRRVTSGGLPDRYVAWVVCRR